jgi:HD-GYP domain-containing protein (c-di-GMP phosphodiesterase class II)
MVSNRPYRSALPVEKAIEEINKMIGVQFDPLVVKSFLEIVDKEGKLDTAIASNEYEDSNDPDSPHEMLKQLFA